MTFNAGIFAGGLAQGADSRMRLGLLQQGLDEEKRKARFDEIVAARDATVSGLKDFITNAGIFRQSQLRAGKQADPTQHAEIVLKMLTDVNRFNSMIGAPEVNPQAVMAVFNEQFASGLSEEEQAAKTRAQTIEQAKTDALAQVAGVDTLATETGLDRNKVLEAAGILPAVGKPQTDAGKAVFDQRLVEEQFGVNSPQAKAVKLANMPQEETADLTDVMSSQREFSKLSGSFIKVRDAYRKVRENLKDTIFNGGTGPRDVAMVFNFMKILDPDSVVREGEQATAQNTTTVPNRVLNTYNRLLVTGARLDDIQRQNMFDAAHSAFGAQLKSQKQLEEQFTGFAQRNLMRPEDVVIDFVGDEMRNPSSQVVTIEQLSKKIGVSVEDIQFTMREENMTLAEFASAWFDEDN